MQTVIELGRVVRDRKTLPLKVGIALTISVCFYLKLANKTILFVMEINLNKERVRIYAQSYKYVDGQVKHLANYQFEVDKGNKPP